MKIDWVEAELESLCDVNMGQSPPSATYNVDGVGLPFFQGKAEFTELYPKTRKWCSSPKKTANANDILLSVRAPVGATNMADQDCAIGRGLASLSYPYCTMYVYYFLNFIERKLDSLGTGTTFRAISGIVLKSQKIPVAPLPEQRAIVAKIEQLFSELDNGIANLKTAQEKLEIYRQAVLKKAFEGELTKTWREQQTDLPTADELLEEIKLERQRFYDQQLVDWEKAVYAWEVNNKQGKKPRKPLTPIVLIPFSLNDLEGLPSLPNGWLWFKYETLCSKIRNGISKKPNGDEKDYKIFRISAVRAHKVNLDDFRYIKNDDNEFDEFLLEKGDLLFTRYNGTRHYVGVCGQFLSHEKYLFPDKLIQTRLVTGKTIPTYIEYACNTFASREYIENRIRTTAGQSGISGGDIKAMPVPICSTKEQNQIVQEIESRLSVCDKLSDTIKEQLVKAEALRQSILKKAFEGRLLSDDELEVCRKEADWEPAEQLLARIKAEKV